MRGEIIEERITHNHGIAGEVVYCAVASAAHIDPHEARRFSARELHAFVRDRIRYRADRDPFDQRIRAPWATLAEGVTDCKSSAIMLAAVNLAAGRHVVLRFTNEDGGEQFGHVYAIIDGVPADPLAAYGAELPRAIAVDVYLHPIETAAA